MSKVITFSRVYPSYHPKGGTLTHFVEKILRGIHDDEHLEQLQRNYEVMRSLNFNEVLNLESVGKFKPKHHTIRGGQRFKVGDWFSPRVWSGKPYASHQIAFAPDLQVKKTWRIDIDKDGCVLIDGKLYAYPNSDFALKPLAANDGLSVPDLFCWFKNSPIKDHQIICWNEKIEY